LTGIRRLLARSLSVATGSCSPAELARLAHLPADCGLQVELDALSADGYMQFQHGRYRLSETGHAALVSGDVCWFAAARSANAVSRREALARRIATAASPGRLV
jgi:hypothetical protein